MRLGVLSDTHDLLRPAVLSALMGVDGILHAGDITSSSILERLAAIAPVRAVRGNCDRGAWARGLPASVTEAIGGHLVHVRHDLFELELSPSEAGIGLVVSGHSHQPARFERRGVIYLNPGSAGPRRFRRPVSMALISLEPGRIEIEFVPLD